MCLWELLKQCLKMKKSGEIRCGVVFIDNAEDQQKLIELGYGAVRFFQSVTSLICVLEEDSANKQQRQFI